MLKGKFYQLLILACLVIPASPAKSDSGDAELSESQTFEINRKNDTVLTLTSRCRVDVDYLSDRGTVEEYLTIYESSRAPVSDVSAALNGKRIKGDHIFDVPISSPYVFLSDERIYVVSFPSNLKSGDHLSYAYRRNYDDIAFLPVLTIPNRYSLKSYTVRFLHPPGVTIDFEYFFPHGALLYTVTRQTPEETILSFESREQARDLPYFPYNDLLAAVLVTVSNDGVPVSPTTPVRLQRWHSRQAKPLFGLDDAHMNMLPVFGDSLATPREKLQAVYEYICRTIRYIADFRGDNDYWPHDPVGVLDKKYGDCKDLACLLNTLANTVQVPVWLCMVGTATPLEFKGVALGLYDHMLCAWRDKGDIRFLDPTARYMPFGSVPGVLVGKPALILDSSDARVEEIAQQDTVVEVGISIRGNIDSLDLCDARIEVRGEMMALAMEIWEKKSGILLKQALDSIITGNLRDVTLADYFLVERGSTVATFTAGADISRFVIHSGKRLYIPHIPFTAFAVDILEREADTLPLYFEKPMGIAMHMDLTMPRCRTQNDTVDYAAQPAASFSARLGSNDSGNISLDYRLMRPLTRIGGRERGTFMTFCRKYLDDRQGMFIAEDI